VFSIQDQGSHLSENKYRYGQNEKIKKTDKVDKTFLAQRLRLMKFIKRFFLNLAEFYKFQIKLHFTDPMVQWL
jgi:hypothetical protein